MSAEAQPLPFEIPDTEQLQQFATLPEAEKEQVIAKVLTMQSVTAEASLRSTEGFDILKELYRSNVEMLLMTSHFIIPTSQGLTEICKHLTDPEGFKRSFATLLGDIERYRQDLTTLWDCHADRTGAPTEDEIADVFALADGYNKLINRFDSAIHPLLEALKQVIVDEYTPVLEKELNDAV